MTTTTYGTLAPLVTRDIVKDILGTKFIGLKVPFGSGNTLFSKSTDNESLVGQIRQLIYTTPGERVMLPNFGLNLNSYLFEPLTPQLIDEIKTNIFTQFKRYVKNAIVLKIVVFSEEVDDPFASASLPTIIIRMSVRNKENNQILPMEFTV
jgi:phage baseplate assembly protein W